MKDKIIIDFDKISEKKDEDYKVIQKYLKYFCRTYRSIIFTSVYPSIVIKWLVLNGMDNFIEEVSLFDNSYGRYAIYFSCEDLKNYYYKKIFLG